MSDVMQGEVAKVPIPQPAELQRNQRVVQRHAATVVSNETQAMSFANGSMCPRQVHRIARPVDRAHRLREKCIAEVLLQ